jgi:hypothetical protein
MFSTGGPDEESITQPSEEDKKLAQLVAVVRDPATSLLALNAVLGQWLRLANKILRTMMFSTLVAVVSVCYLLLLLL